MIDVAAVRRIPRFSGVSPEAHEWLAQNLARRVVAKGQILFVEGEESQTVYLVERGVVKVFRSLESGRELIIGLFRFGEAVGEVAVIDGQPYPATAAAHEESIVLTMPRQAYLHYLKFFDGAAIALIRDLMLRMRTMQRRMEDLGGGDVEYRLARVLQGFCAACRNAEGPLVLPVPLTRQDLADMVGARVETVIRIMSRWQKEGFVGSDDRGLWVRDRRTLDNLAHSD
jgi:CRP/FNR family transcriptional regulator, cyclic AMP receptor protein